MLYRASSAAHRSSTRHVAGSRRRLNSRPDDARNTPAAAHTTAAAAPRGGQIAHERQQKAERRGEAQRGADLAHAGAPRVRARRAHDEQRGRAAHPRDVVRADVAVVVRDARLEDEHVREADEDIVRPESERGQNGVQRDGAGRITFSTASPNARKHMSHTRIITNRPQPTIVTRMSGEKNMSIICPRTSAKRSTNGSAASPASCPAEVARPRPSS